jgi:hypothetical protein
MTQDIDPDCRDIIQVEPFILQSPFVRVTLMVFQGVS